MRGGGIYNSGTLHLSNCAINGNQANAWRHAYGGGLYNSGKASLTGLEINGNSGYWDRQKGIDGAAVYNERDCLMTVENTRITFNSLGNGPAVVGGGDLSLIRCSLVGNGGFSGGAIHGAILVRDSQIESNWSGVGGGYIVDARVIEGSTISGNNSAVAGIVAATEINNSTIVSNGSDRDGLISGRVSNSTIIANSSHHDACQSVAGITASKNSLIMGNGAWGNGFVGCDCTSYMTSLGHNVIGAGQNCSGLSDGGIGDLIGVDWTSILESSNLSPLLADNAGPTSTVALLPNSLAIDAIPQEACTDLHGNPNSLHQRGVSRPQGSGCDIGSFEFIPPEDVTFWMHQCRDKKFAIYGEAELNELFSAINDKSDAFPECALATCALLEPDGAQSSWKSKAARELLAVWLNLASGRLTKGRPVELQGLSNATSVGVAVVEIEAAICDPNATKQQLQRVRDIGVLLNGGAN